MLRTIKIALPQAFALVVYRNLYGEGTQPFSPRALAVTFVAMALIGIGNYFAVRYAEEV